MDLVTIQGFIGMQYTLMTNYIINDTFLDDNITHPFIDETMEMNVNNIDSIFI